MINKKINRKIRETISLSFLVLSIFFFFGLNPAMALSPGTNIEVCADDPGKNAPYANTEDPYHPILYYWVNNNGFYFYQIQIYRVSGGALMHDTGQQWQVGPGIVAGSCTYDYIVPADVLPVDNSQYKYMVRVQNTKGDWTPYAEGYFYLYSEGLCGKSDASTTGTYGGTYCPGTLPSVTTPDLCLNAQADPVEVTGGTGPDDPWEWICHGAVSGHDSPQCSANVREAEPGSAGSELSREICPPGIISTNPADLCSLYDIRYPPVVTGNGTTIPWTWMCSNTCSTGPDQGVAFSRFYSPQINASCGSASGKNFCGRESEPAVGDLCLPSGSQASDRIQTYNEWTWNCSGQCGGTSASCKAGNFRACGWIETNP